MDLEARFRDAVAHFWDARERQTEKQREGGMIDAGTRSAVTGGTQMGAIEVLIRDILVDAGLEALDIRIRTALELPGYFRTEKKWDLLVVSKGRLVLAIELKSQVGSFGNNLNNRVEEAIGNATDLWTAYRESRYGTAIPRPFLGFFFLLEDTPRVHRAVAFKEPYFSVDPIFRDASYAKRYEILCHRLVLERLYTASCLTLTAQQPLSVAHPTSDLSFTAFAAAIEGHALTFRKTIEQRYSSIVRELDWQRLKQASWRGRHGLHLAAEEVCKPYGPRPVPVSCRCWLLLRDICQEASNSVDFAAACST